MSHDWLPATQRRSSAHQLPWTGPSSCGSISEQKAKRVAQTSALMSVNVGARESRAALACESTAAFRGISSKWSLRHPRLTH